MIGFSSFNYRFTVFFLPFQIVYMKKIRKKNVHNWPAQPPRAETHFRFSITGLRSLFLLYL